MEAKLRRAYQEGQAARLAGQDPLAAELAALLHKPKPHAATPALLTAPEDHDHTPADPTPPPQSPPKAAVGVSQQSSDAGRADGCLSREEQLSMAQADANMAALLQEEAGSACLLTSSPSVICSLMGRLLGVMMVSYELSRNIKSSGYAAQLFTRISQWKRDMIVSHQINTL